MIRIAIDAMGGDLAPAAIVKGAIDSLSSCPDTKLLLFGDEKAVQEEYAKYQYDKERIEIIPCSENISLHESPVMAIRRKKDSGIVRGMKAVKDGEAEAFLSAGSTGAILAGAQLIVGREKGVLRPPLAALMPTRQGVTLLTDCGANVDAHPEWLVQFAKMGAIYMKEMLGVPSPTVGLVNIGAEEEKGNALVKAAMEKCKEEKDLNFIGSVEARDIVEGNCSVVVADAFVGNVVLKMYEGVGKMLLSEIKSGIKEGGPLSLVGGALISSALRKRMKRFDAKSHGGAPILGLKGLVVKVHGNTDGVEITTAIRQAKEFAEKGLTKKIAEALDFSDKEKESKEEA